MIYLDGTSLNLEKLRMIAEKNEPVGISDEAVKNVKKSRDSLMKIVSTGTNRSVSGNIWYNIFI